MHLKPGPTEMRDKAPPTTGVPKLQPVSESLGRLLKTQTAGSPPQSF